jgi:MFS family permease
MFDKRHVLAGIYSLLGLGTLAFSSIHQRWLLLPFLILFAPALGGSLPLRGALVREYSGSASFGRVIGIVYGIAAFGGVIGTAVAGWTFDTVGSYRPVWLSFAAMSVVPVLFVLRLNVTPQENEE